MASSKPGTAVGSRGSAALIMPKTLSATIVMSSGAKCATDSTIVSRKLPGTPGRTLIRTRCLSPAATVPVCGITTMTPGLEAESVAMEKA